MQSFANYLLNNWPYSPVCSGILLLIYIFVKNQILLSFICKVYFVAKTKKHHKVKAGEEINYSFDCYSGLAIPSLFSLMFLN